MREPDYALLREIHLPPIRYTAQWGRIEMVRRYAAMETARRAARLILALEAWKLQHGSLPEKLDELVGTCLDELPTDPYSGEPFRYFRDGLKVPLEWHQPLYPTFHSYYAHESFGMISAEKPFLWSTGTRIRSERNAAEVLNEYFILGYSDGRRMDDSCDTSRLIYRRARNENELWEAGWPFPIP